MNMLVAAVVTTCILMLMTFPGWLCGKILAHRNRTLPVPFVLRLKAVRWALWYLFGIATVMLLIVARSPIGSVEDRTRVICVGAAAITLALTVVVAFYIGWTSSAQRLARKRHAASAGLPISEGYSELAGENDPRRLATAAEADEYAPAQPEGE